MRTSLTHTPYHGARGLTIYHRAWRRAAEAPNFYKTSNDRDPMLEARRMKGFG
jgi:hypothetical protein